MRIRLLIGTIRNTIMPNMSPKSNRPHSGKLAENAPQIPDEKRMVESHDLLGDGERAHAERRARFVAEIERRVGILGVSDFEEDPADHDPALLAFCKKVGAVIYCC